MQVGSLHEKVHVVVEGVPHDLQFRPGPFGKYYADLPDPVAQHLIARIGEAGGFSEVDIPIPEPAPVKVVAPEESAEVKAVLAELRERLKQAEARDAAAAQREKDLEETERQVMAKLAALSAAQQQTEAQRETAPAGSPPLPDGEKVDTTANAGDKGKAKGK